ncbi:Hypothetical predicted protein [Mytilus galloprovincialis]|uniref:Uncharacterized protein n=1 Tax=Mytilus galloprovincialis TaxID=29158 RepID=A0A8B6FXT6_MYTGA|nr:Hypothetical predicted protein [Mytilus galloprovincialis]
MIRNKQHADFQLLNKNEGFNLIWNGNSDVDLESAEFENDLVAWTELIKTQHPPFAIGAAVTGPETKQQKNKKKSARRQY